MRTDRPRTPFPSGVDAIDLAEFPLSLLSDVPPAGTALLLEFTAREKRWQIAGHPRYGLPTACDVELYVLLMQRSREYGFAGRIPFCRRQLLVDLGWGTGAAKYERLTLAFRRLAHTTFTATRAVHDPKTGEWLEEHGFQLLGGYRLYRRRETEDPEGPTPWPCWFRWSPTVEELLLAGYHHELDAQQYLAFDSAVTQAVYRHLTARFRDGKTEYRQDLRTFAQQHIGLRQRYVSHIQNKLARPHRELIACGFVESVEYATAQTGDHLGEVMVIYRRRKHRLTRRAVEPTKSADPLVERLVQVGVSRSVAVALVGEKPGECRRQLEFLAHRGARDRAAVLVKAIREEWEPPQAWTDAQAALGAKARARKQRSRAAAKDREAATDEAAFDDWWAKLPDERQTEIMIRAREELFAEGELVARLWRDRVDTPAFFEAVRDLRKKHSGWADTGQGEPISSGEERS
jgi:hypothetical protein